MPAVPLIDFAPYRDGSAKREVAASVGRACETIGFLVLAGHGLPQRLVDDAFATAGAFFAQDEAEKRRAAPPSGLVPRGWHGLASKTLSRTLGIETPPDLREQFYLGPLDPVPHSADADEFYRPNIWPERPAAYRGVFAELYRRCEGLSAELMRSFALALGLDEHFFDDKIDRHFATLAANYYPVPAGALLDGQLRAGAHTDFGSLTLLLMDDAPGGLEVETAPGEWSAVRPARGQIVVNLGDMMARWTNDRWRSTLHRVANPPASAGASSRRQSIAFFLHPNYDAEIACLPGTGAPRYAPIRAGEHMRMKMERRLVAS